MVKSQVTFRFKKKKIIYIIFLSCHLAFLLLFVLHCTSNAFYFISAYNYTMKCRIKEVYDPRVDKNYAKMMTKLAVVKKY